MDSSTGILPPLFVPHHDYQQLTALVDGHLADRFPDEIEALRSELDRALVVIDDSAADDVVTMHSTVEYIDCASGRAGSATLVYPWEADPADGQISILAPLATALLGLRVGDTIRWETPSGRRFGWKVLAVRQASI